MVVKETGSGLSAFVREAMINAQEFAQSRNSDSVTTCEVLIGLSMQEDCSAANFLHSKGITTQDIIEWWDKVRG